MLLLDLSLNIPKIKDESGIETGVNHIYITMACAHFVYVQKLVCYIRFVKYYYINDALKSLTNLGKTTHRLAHPLVPLKQQKILNPSV